LNNSSEDKLKEIMIRDIVRIIKSPCDNTIKHKVVLDLTPRLYALAKRIPSKLLRKIANKND
jgi:hypothetical protein